MGDGATTTDQSDEPTPGFGALLAVAGIVIALVALRRSGRDGDR